MIEHRVTKHPYPYPVFRNLSIVEENGREIAAVLNQLYGNAEIGLLVTGSSGLLIGQIVWGYLRSKNDSRLWVVRKSGEESHHPTDLIGTPPILFVIDDLISSGNTVFRIAQALTASQKLNVKGISCQASLGEVDTHCKSLFPNLQHLIS